MKKKKRIFPGTLLIGWIEGLVVSISPNRRAMVLSNGMISEGDLILTSNNSVYWYPDGSAFSTFFTRIVYN